jgi:hypothetical protein
MSHTDGKPGGAFVPQVPGGNGNGNGHGNGHGAGGGWWLSLWHGRRRKIDQMASYRRVALQLHYDLQDAGSPRSVLVVLPADVKPDAEAATALACCLADELRKPTLLIDACPRVPAATRKLGCAGAFRGFSELLNPNPPALTDLILHTSHENLSFLPAGAISPTSQSALPGAPERILRESLALFDFVVLAGGSVRHDSLSLALAPLVGSALLSLRENETRKDDLAFAREVLMSCKVRKVGMLLSAQGRRGADRY